MADPDVLAAGLLAWARGRDPRVAAAVRLLAGRGSWLRRADFTRACVTRSGGQARVGWAAARRFAETGLRASTSEMAVLDLAVALGENRYRLSVMGPVNSRLIAGAVARAVGEQL